MPSDAAVWFALILRVNVRYDGPHGAGVARYLIGLPQKLERRLRRIARKLVREHRDEIVLVAEFLLARDSLRGWEIDNIIRLGRPQTPSRYDHERDCWVWDDADIREPVNPRRRRAA